MVNRQDGNGYVVAGEVHRLARRVDRRNDILLRQHHAFAASRRTRRKAHFRHAVKIRNLGILVARRHAVLAHRHQAEVAVAVDTEPPFTKV